MTWSTARILNLTRRCKKGLSNTIAVLHPFKAQWLLYVLQSLTLKIIRSAHAVYLCVLYESQKKQPLFSLYSIN